MSSVHSIARGAIQKAVEEATAAGLDGSAVCKALVAQALAQWITVEAADSVRSAVEFELQHMAGDSDIEFMRP